MKIAVIAHEGKSLGGGLDELRTLLPADIWHTVPKSRKAPKKVRRALADGADLIVVWGGDGMLQRCMDAGVGSAATFAIIPAGTANLLAHNLGIPEDLPAAVQIALTGHRRRLDLGRVNGEHFAVMAGLGFDGDMIHEADGGLKDRLGRLAYVWTGLRAVGDDPVAAKVRVDGETWFRGDATCVLFGNVPRVFAGVAVFDGAEPDDGLIDVGIATAHGSVQWARTLARMSSGPSDRSPFVQMTRGKRVSVRLDRPMRYELDGGSRTQVRRLKVRVVPGAVTVCVPSPESGGDQAQKLVVGDRVGVDRTQPERSGAGLQVGVPRDEAGVVLVIPPVDRHAVLPHADEQPAFADRERRHLV
jgi:diacylglycerol kinase (ATP)